jgi:hypothetical protein
LAFSECIISHKVLKGAAIFQARVPATLVPIQDQRDCSGNPAIVPVAPKHGMMTFFQKLRLLGPGPHLQNTIARMKKRHEL